MLEINKQEEKKLRKNAKEKRKWNEGGKLKIWKRKNLMSTFDMMNEHELLSWS